MARGGCTVAAEDWTAGAVTKAPASPGWSDMENPFNEEPEQQSLGIAAVDASTIQGPDPPPGSTSDSRPLGPWVTDDFLPSLWTKWSPDECPLLWTVTKESAEMCSPSWTEGSTDR